MQRLLLVDDHSSVATAFGYLLGQLDPDIQTQTASSFAEAQQLIQKEISFDLVLLDYAMQPVDGLSALKQIKATNPDQAIAFYSGVVEPELMNETMRAGAIGWIPKSMEAQPLLHALKLMLAGEQFFPADHLRQLIKQNTNPLIADFTPREQEVALLLAEGLTDKEIAAKLNLGTSTVTSHVRTILKRTNSGNRTKFALAMQRSNISEN